MGEWIWLTCALSGHCLITGLPEGEGFVLHLANEAGRLRPLPGPVIAARAGATGDPPPLSRYAIALANDQNREFGFAPRFGIAVDVAEHGAQGAHLRPAETIAEMLEQLAISQGDSSL